MKDEGRRMNSSFILHPFHGDTMRTIDWKKLAQSWWGRSLMGAFIGGLLVAFSGVDSPTVFLGGMVLGAVVLFFLGRLQ